MLMAKSQIEITPTKDGFLLTVLAQYPGQENYAVTVQTTKELETA